MTNVDTVKAITDNIEAALKKEGMDLSATTYEEGGPVPAGLVPVARIFYTGVAFEDTYGERPSYADALFTLKTTLGGRPGRELMQSEQMWAQRIRDALTPSALNAGDLAASRLVSRVTVNGVEVSNKAESSTIICRITVRYREV